jgi:hypothetical protein
MCVCTLYIYIYIYIYTFAHDTNHVPAGLESACCGRAHVGPLHRGYHIHTRSGSIGMRSFNVYVCMCVCMYVCIFSMDSSIGDITSTLAAGALVCIIYVCVCERMYVYMHVLEISHQHSQRERCYVSSTCVCVNVCMYVYTSWRYHIDTRTGSVVVYQAHVYMCVCIHVCMHVRVGDITSTLAKGALLCIRHMCICVYVYMYVCTSELEISHQHLQRERWHVSFTCGYLCTYTYMEVYLNAHLCTYMHTYTQTYTEM